MLCGILGEFGGRMNTCMCMAKSLLCSPFRIPTFVIGYTPVLNEKKKKIFSYPFSLPSPKRLNSWREIGNGWPISVSYTVQLSPCLGPICTFHRFCMLEGRVFRVHFSSITQSCPTLCNPMDCSIPGSLVHHQLPELAQTHVH